MLNARILSHAFLKTSYKQQERFCPSVFLGAFAKFRKELQLSASSRLVCLFNRMEQLGSLWKDFHWNCYLSIFRKSVQNMLISLNMTSITGTLHEDRYRFFFNISRWIPFNDKRSRQSCRENQNTQFVIIWCFFWPCIIA